MNRQRVLELLSRSKPELQARFVTSGLTYDATLRNLELIGEAATRNRLIHGYLGIDNDTLWSIIRDDMPELLQMLRAHKHEMQS